MNTQAFKETGKGFHITFKNGITVSVQWDMFNYGDVGKTTAEVAAWTRDGNWWEFEENNNNTVMGHQTPEQVINIMKMFSDMSEEEINKGR